MALTKSVLIVEDDRDLRENLSQVLEMEGYRTFLAEHGGEALDILTSMTPDDLPGCILLDLMMPVMDGRALVEALIDQHQDEWANIAIIVNTARRSPEGALPALPYTVEILRKPLDIDELLRAVEPHCRLTTC